MVLRCILSPYFLACSFTRQMDVPCISVIFPHYVWLHRMYCQVLYTASKISFHKKLKLSEIMEISSEVSSLENSKFLRNFRASLYSSLFIRSTLSEQVCFVWQTIRLQRRNLKFEITQKLVVDIVGQQNNLARKDFQHVCFTGYDKSLMIHAVAAELGYNVSVWIWLNLTELRLEMQIVWNQIQIEIGSLK